MLSSLMTGDLVAARQAELLVAAEDERLAIRMRRASRAGRRLATAGIHRQLRDTP